MTLDVSLADVTGVLFLVLFLLLMALLLLALWTLDVFGTFSAVVCFQNWIGELKTFSLNIMTRYETV